MSQPAPMSDPGGFEPPEMLPDVPEADAFDGAVFHPTLRRPLPSIQCQGAIRNGPRAGDRCNRRASLGGRLCLVHGGQLPNNKKLAEARVAAARLKLIESADEAVDWIIDLGRNATSEAVRLGAAREVLERSGIKSATEIDVTVHQGESPAEVLRARLEKLGEAARLSSRTIDGTVVEPPSPLGDGIPDDTVATTDPVPPPEENHD